MNREDIIRMAIEAELNLYVNDLTEKQYIEVVERFAALVASAEREACAICRSHPSKGTSMTKDEALKLALEALEHEADKGNDDAYKVERDAIKEALAEPEQEPVAWMCADESLINKGYARFSHVCMGDWKIPVYTTPPQRTWVGLTDEEIEMVYAVTIKIRKKDIMPGEQKMFAKTIQHFLKERNT